MHILNQINTHDIQCIYIMIEQFTYARMEQSIHITMEQSNRANGTSMPHVLQLSAPVPVSILPQPQIPIYFEYEPPYVCPTPSHNTNHNQNWKRQLRQCYKTLQSPKNDPSELPRTPLGQTPQTGIK